MKRQFREELGERLSIPPEVISSQPVIQLHGRRNVCIENHGGILAYTDGCVRISVRGGSVSVEGTGLSIVRMTRHAVEIRGSIRSLALE